MIRLPPGSTRTYTLYPDTTLFRSHGRWSITRSSIFSLPSPASCCSAAAVNALVFEAIANSVRASTWSGLPIRSEEHTSELQLLMRLLYAVLCLTQQTHIHTLRIFFKLLDL